MDRKLIYILNHYSNKSTQHFYHVINLLKEIADNGVQVLLIIEKCEGTPDINHENIKLVCQKETNKLKRLYELFTILKKYIKEGYTKTFVRISKGAAIASIITNKFYGGQVYYWISGTTLEIDKGKLVKDRVRWFLKSYLSFWFIKEFTTYFVTGPKTMKDYYIKVGKVKEKKILLLDNDIDINRFKKVSEKEKKEIRKKLNLEDKKILLMVHRLSPVRKSDYYIPFIINSDEIKNDNIKLVIVGDGPEKPLLNKLIKENKLEKYVDMVGSIPNEKIQEYYKIADIFINPSYTEGFPRVIIEAMASGLPVIATDAGGTIDIVPDEQNKYIVNKDNRDLFRTKILKLLNDREEMNKLSICNMEFVKRYSTESVAKQYIERIFNEKCITHKC